MDEPDWDDPAVEEHWCDERRKQVIAYLRTENVNHGTVGGWPAWHVAPYVSLWAVESLIAPGHVGWWAICGDLPTDYLSAATVRHPRKALFAFADTWKELADHQLKGTNDPHMSMGRPEKQSELAPLLDSRSNVLRRFAEDDDMWGAEYD